MQVHTMESLEEYASRTNQPIVKAYTAWHESGNELAVRLNEAEKRKEGSGILGRQCLGLNPEDVRALQTKVERGDWSRGRN